MRLTENAFIEPAGTKLDSFVETELILAGVIWCYYGDMVQTNWRKSEKYIFDSAFSETVSQIYSSSEVSGGGVEGISGFFKIPLITLSILFVFSSSIG